MSTVITVYATTRKKPKYPEYQPIDFVLPDGSRGWVWLRATAEEGNLHEVLDNARPRKGEIVLNTFSYKPKEK